MEEDAVKRAVEVVVQSNEAKTPIKCDKCGGRVVRYLTRGAPELYCEDCGAFFGYWDAPRRYDPSADD